MKTKRFTKEQINNMTDNQLRKLIWVTNDGQGDTNAYSLFEQMYVHIQEWNVDEYAEPDPSNLTTIEYIKQILYSETNGNMSFFLWVEDNECFKVYIEW